MKTAKTKATPRYSRDDLKIIRFALNEKAKRFEDAIKAEAMKELPFRAADAIVEAWTNHARRLREIARDFA